MVEGSEEKADYHTVNDEANKAIIANLADACEDAEISTVIKSYTIGSPNLLIRKQLKVHLLPPLKKAATYLQLKIDGILKDDLVTSIIQKIETLLMDLCAVCGEYYSNSLQDQPLFKCLMCNQGCHHECYTEMQTLLQGVTENLRHAFHFICTRCYGEFDDNHSSLNPTAEKKPKSPTKEKEPQPEAITNDHQNQDDRETEEPRPAVTEPKKPICPQYKYGRCMNYETCKNQYDHPRRCRNMLMFRKCRFGICVDPT